MGTPEQENGQGRRVALVVGLVLLCALVALVVVFLAGASDGPDIEANSSQDVLVGHVPRPEDRGVPKTGKPAASPSTSTEHEKYGPKIYDAPTRTVTIRFIDSNGEPVTGETVRYELSNVIMKIMRDDPARSPSVKVEWLRSSAITDSKGTIALDAVPIESGVLLYLDTPLWTVTETPNADSYFVLPVNGWTLPPTIDEQTVRLSKPGTVTLEIMYEDGTPVTGTLGYSVWKKDTPTADKETGYPRDPIQLFGESIVTLDRLPPVGRLWGKIDSTREGYALTTGFDFRIEAGSRHKVVVPRDDTARWGLEIDLTSAEGDEVLNVAVYTERGVRIEEFRQVGPGLVRTINLAPHTSVASVLVLGDRTWKSDRIDLSTTPGQWYRVVAQLTKGATAKMRIVDEDGKPIHPAVALYDSNQYVDWRKPSRYEKAKVSDGVMQRHFACADKDGHISYVGLAAGTYELTIEAQGFLRAKQRIVLRPEEVNDLGDIVLRKATAENSGTIRITLDGISEPERYTASIAGMGQPFECRPPVQFDANGVATISLLDLRPFTVYVRKSPTAQYTSAELACQVEVYINGDQPIAEITVTPDSPKRFTVGR